MWCNGWKKNRQSQRCCHGLSRNWSYHSGRRRDCNRTWVGSGHHPRTRYGRLGSRRCHGGHWSFRGRCSSRGNGNKRPGNCHWTGGDWQRSGNLRSGSGGRNYHCQGGHYQWTSGQLSGP